MNVQKNLILMYCAAGTLIAFLFAVPLLASAQEPGWGFLRGDKEFTLSGSGASDKNFNDTIFTTSLSLGYFFTNQLEAALRQDISFADTPGDNVWNGATNIAVDYHFGRARLQPLVGASIGYVYGKGIKDQWEAGPELGLKIFLNKTTFVRLMGQYQFFFSNDNIHEDFEDGRFVYGLGLGLRF